MLAEQLFKASREVATTTEKQSNPGEHHIPVQHLQEDLLDTIVFSVRAVVTKVLGQSKAGIRHSFVAGCYFVQLMRVQQVHYRTACLRKRISAQSGDCIREEGGTAW